MPWTGKSFASKHNKKLDTAAAEKASRVANAMIKSGADEGTAIATANKYGNKMNRSPIYKEMNKRSRDS